MPRKRWLTVALVVLVVTVGSLSEVHARHWIRAAQDNPNKMPASAPVLVVSGTLGPEATVPIEAPDWNPTVPLNSYVTRGQVIGDTVASMSPDQAVRDDEPVLPPDEATLTVAQAEDDAGRAETDLEVARASETDDAVQEVTTKVAERQAEQRLENADRLHELGEMSAARHDRAVLADSAAVNAVETAQSRAEADTSTVDDATKRLQNARAKLAEAERQQRFALVATEPGGERGSVAVVSPADGLLVARDPDGASYGISTKPDVLRVETWIPEDDILKVRVGQPASIGLGAEPQVTLRARVSEIGALPVDSTNGGVYPVALSVDNPRGLLLAGEPVEVRLSGLSGEIRPPASESVMNPSGLLQ